MFTVEVCSKPGALDSKNAIKCGKMFSVFEIIAFELLARMSLNYDENRCAWQSTCYETVL